MKKSMIVFGVLSLVGGVGVWLVSNSSALQASVVDAPTVACSCGDSCPGAGCTCGSAECAKKTAAVEAADLGAQKSCGCGQKTTCGAGSCGGGCAAAATGGCSAQ